VSEKQHHLLSNNISGLPEHIFKQYDIRGVVTKDFTTGVAHDIGLAIGSAIVASGHKKVIIGRDGRLSGPKIAASLRSGIIKTGCDVIDIGVVPTPILYYAAETIGHGTGVMVTGSHNPKDYNGLKMVINGHTLSGKDIQGLKQRILNGDIVEGKSLGKQRERAVTWDYINNVDENVKLEKQLKIVVDAGNGVAGDCAPDLFREIGCSVDEIFCQIDGHFPNHHPDPSKPENLQDLIQRVKKIGADLGLAFDGDGDRLGVVTSTGKIINPDRQLMLYAREMLKSNQGAKVIYDVKCSKSLDGFIKDAGGEPEMYKTGHALIKKRMKETGAALAGEMSGHVFFNDRWYGFDDALYTGARLLEILSKTDKTSDELFAEIPDSINTPEINIAIKASQRELIVEYLNKTVSSKFPAANIITIDGLRIEFNDGWGLIRPSNTTSVLVMRFEADSEEVLQRIEGDIKSWVDDAISDSL
jgi:phosphomannomutase/phosphoglucomutase